MFNRGSCVFVHISDNNVFLRCVKIHGILIDSHNKDIVLQVTDKTSKIL